jgi:hypothetical protein
MAKEITSVTCSHKSLQGFMDRNYAYLNYQIQPFKGTITIPLKGLQK